MVWRAYICDTQSGTVKNRVRLASCPWARNLNGGTSGQAVLSLRDKTNASLDLNDLLDPVRNTIVLDWDGVAVYAGIIQDDDDSLDNLSTTINHADLWWLLSRRLAVDYTAPHVEDTAQTYTDLDLGTIAKRRVQLATTGDADRNLALPITYPNDAAGTITRPFHGYDLHWLAVMSRQVVESADGWGSDCGVVPVMIVEVQPARECGATLGL